MSDIIKYVGQQLADSIVASLSPAHSAPTPSTPTVHNAPTDMVAHGLDLSQVQLMPHRKVKEHPSLKGDDTDTVDVQEWENLMKNYSGSDVTLNPDTIFPKHFAAVPFSPHPLAEFYTTLPKSNEDAYDY